MIQVLTYSGKDEKFQGKDVKINSLHDAESLDSFSINVFFLTDSELWQCDEPRIDSINKINDLKSLSEMIENSQTTKNIVILPRNLTFYYYKWDTCGEFQHSCELKDMISKMKCHILSELCDQIEDFDIIYENTRTKIGEEEIAASFYFNMVDEEAITKSVGSNKITTIKIDEIYFSFLNLECYEDLIAFLRVLGLIQEKQESPKWMEEIKMFDDDKQLQLIEENNQAIAQANANITKAMNVINKNNKYKSILYTNGDELVDVVFEIFEEMLGCDLSTFTDTKKEDFRFILNSKVFIGEIKGVTPNVKKSNVSQVDQHVQEYLDNHEGEEENIVSLLIINHQRNKPLSERECVPAEQVRLAERNKTLIIETITLLKLFEKYLNDEKTREECIDLLQNHIGILDATQI